MDAVAWSVTLYEFNSIMCYPIWAHITFLGGRKHIAISDKQYALLFEGILRATESSLSNTALYQERSFFPFSFTHILLTEISHYYQGRLEIKQQGPGRILISTKRDAL